MISPRRGEPLRGTPLAHAEMNALGAARTGWDLGGTTLWSTQEPCGMCAAAEFTGVGEVRYPAPDPWAPAGGSGTGAEAEGGVWVLAANVMFLRSVVAAAQGPGEPRILAHHRTAEPETASLRDALPPGLPASPAVETWPAPLWPAVRSAAASRASRTS
ncbi:deaminase [Streptomyces sp. NBC_01443]|uniref:deaminase n=1 Tax=Streptomyces sp. NBC_01443 TaxID=2903868 RepID=UPI0022540486|nr:deaminase [Streptomyces sp. NBC_01443]MCX4629798.1 deaminase [Streptomyces sp. NBC_01443]